MSPPLRTFPLRLTHHPHVPSLFQSLSHLQACFILTFIDLTVLSPHPSPIQCECQEARKFVFYFLLYPQNTTWHVVGRCSVSFCSTNLYLTRTPVSKAAGVPASSKHQMKAADFLSCIFVVTSRTLSSGDSPNSLRRLQVKNPLRGRSRNMGSG